MNSNSHLSILVIVACLVGAVLLGLRIRRWLPEDHLNADTRDTVKVAVGLVATMSVLLLGLLVSSAKDSYDTIRSEIIQMAAKVTFLDRVLTLYGPEAAPLRAGFHIAVREANQQMWATDGSMQGMTGQGGDTFFAEIQSLSPRDDLQRRLKSQAEDSAVELAQLRTLVGAQSVASISRPLLLVVVLWLVIIFLAFSVLAPANATAKLALLVSAFSVAGAVFLILEMDRPFSGIIRISSDPMVNALKHISKPAP